MVGGLVCDSCGVPLPGPEDGQAIECDECMQNPRPWGQGRAALIYRDNARRLVLGLKHGDRQELVRPAAKWMAAAAKPLLRPNMIVAPVPLHRLRLLRRRYNQAALLAQALAQELGLEFCPDLLVRPQQRGSMDGLTHEERFSKMENAIAPHTIRMHKMAARPVLLVDDVMTSGATFAATTQACFQARAREVNVLALARVAKDA